MHFVKSVSRLFQVHVLAGVGPHRELLERASPDYRKPYKVRIC